jgi:pimeloyl-ACP methyl ester carboxylesterase
MIASQTDDRCLMVEGRPVRCRTLEPDRGVSARVSLGRPLLLLHGLGCSADAWEPALDCLAVQGLDQPVWAPDMPGYGQSPGPPEALGMEELADWAVRLLDRLSVDRAHLAGNSMGCQVALALARRHPERVGGLVLTGPTTGAQGARLGRYCCGLLLDGLREPMAYNRTLLRMYLQQGVRRYLATARKMLEDDPLTDAGAVRAPCLVVRGSGDGIVPREAARRLAAALPRGVFTEVESCAHAVQYHRPEGFTRLLLEFLTNSAAGIPALSAARGGNPAF